MVATDKAGPSLRFGIVGLGQASASTVPSIAGHPHALVSAAASARPEARDRFAQEYGAQTFETIQQLCASPDVDAIYIGTPTQFHTEHVLIAAEHGKHIICEKPMAITLDEADRMIEAVERHGVKMVVGQSQSFEPPIKKIRELVKGGELGALRMINSWYYNDWLFRPRLPEEMETSLGGGVVFRQGAHHFDVARLIAGGIVRSVRATAGVWDPARPTEGAYSAFLQFDNGAVAMLAYNGYDHFHTVELTGVGESGEAVKDRAHAAARKRLEAAGGPEGERALKGQRGWGVGGSPRRAAERHQAYFGLTIVSCDRADIRQSPDGLLIYGDREVREVPLEPGVFGRDLMVQELYEAVVQGKPVIHDGRWSKATLEVSMAVLQSAREQREVPLQHQVPVND